MINTPMKIAIVDDGERVAYSVNGSADTAIVFIHGWNCDSRYWTNQLAPFAEKYKVIAVDLVGHGHSSASRKQYTIDAYALDIQSVIKQEKVKRAVLVGHSLAGSVIAESAAIAPEKTIAIIGVDTLHDVGETISQKAFDDRIATLSNNFVDTMRGIVEDMFIEGANPSLVSWVKEDMSSTPKNISLNIYSNFKARFVSGEFTRVFSHIKVPVLTINGSLLPTNVAANQKYIKHYKNFLIEGAGHFPMLEQPERFNELLQKAISYVVESAYH